MPHDDLKCPLLTLVDRKMTLNLPFSWVINLFSSSVGVVLIFKTISSFLWFFNAVSISALELFRLSKVRRRRFACLNIKILNQKGQDKKFWRSSENLSSKILISRGFEFLVSQFLIFHLGLSDLVFWYLDKRSVGVWHWTVWIAPMLKLKPRWKITKKKKLF